MLHLNFFLALFLNALFNIISHAVIVFPELESNNNLKGQITDNGPGCKLMQVLTYYVRTCTYMWMLCEGYYLHRQITSVFEKQRKLWVFYLIGWAFPALPTTIFSIVMKLKHDALCWAAPPYSIFWTFRSVFIACIVLNILFLGNIVRVLFTKIAIQSNEPQYYRTAVKATVILIPVFGVHFVLSSVLDGREETVSCTGATIHAYFNNAIDGLQGFIVVLIFCYTNKEVIGILKLSYEQFRIRHGFQPKPTRNRWSLSTQLSNGIDPQHKDSIPMSNRKGTESNGSVPVTNVDSIPMSNRKDPESNGSVPVPNGDITKKGQETGPGITSIGGTTSIAVVRPINSEYDNQGFGFDNVYLSKDKVTEL